MRGILYTTLALASSLSISTSIACTDFRVAAKDGTQVIARSMEFAMPLNSDIISIPRGTAYGNTAPDGKPSMSWKSKYGYVMVDGLKQVFTIDGMNEAGLSFEYLYLPGFTQYQTVPAGKDNQAIPYFYFGDWVLGNFKSVDEVRQALANVYVYSQTLPAIGEMVFPLHAAIHDASGKGIVVEFINGQMQISDYVGVMTNAPTYQWHVQNLPQYLNLSPYNPKPVIANGISYGANGEGAGMIGLPGDISPASRFTKIAFMLQYAYQVENATSAVNLAEHIINNVDIPAGIARANNNGQETYETTEWTVFKDLTHKVFYYHTYQDLTLRSVDLKQVDFSEKAPKLVMPLSSAPTVLDVTGKFKLSFMQTKADVPTPAAAPALTVAPTSAAALAPAADPTPATEPKN